MHATVVPAQCCAVPIGESQRHYTEPTPPLIDCPAQTRPALTSSDKRFRQALPSRKFREVYSTAVPKPGAPAFQQLSSAVLQLVQSLVN